MNSIGSGTLVPHTEIGGAEAPLPQNSKMGEWRESRLRNYIKVKHGFAFKGEHITTEENHDILITPGNFNIGGGFKNSKIKYFTGEYPEEYILKHNDIVVTMTDLSKETDTLGYSAKVPKSDRKRYLHNQRIGLVQFKNDDINKEYLYWLMRTREYQCYIVGSASGTSIMHTSPTRIEDYTCWLPPLKEQKAIAEVLSSLDDKIDLLHRQNKTLEELAQTLFRQWFVEEAREEWKVVTVGDFVKTNSSSIKKDCPLSTIQYLDTSSLTEGKIDTLQLLNLANAPSRARRIVKHNDVLISTVRPNQKHYGIMKNPTENIIVSTGFCVISCEKINPHFIYMLLTADDMTEYLHSIAEGSTSTYPSLKPSDIEAVEFLLPPEEKLKVFSDYADNAWNKIDSNYIQMKTLENMRETLLPKLMTGEGRISL